ncbi:MAG: GTP-binding protein [Anaerolineaceae bacterium]|nr:GTP-binding protein [Anaerolineaceae bacterium]
MHTGSLLKVIIVGDGGVGKTSLVRQWCEGKFVQSRIMTIGVDFQTKMVRVPEGEVKLSIWDVAGQQRFAPVREGFYRGALVAALVYDLNDIKTLVDLGRWLKEIRQFEPTIRLLLVGNKSDLGRSAEAEGREFAKRLGAQFIITSARTGEGVEDMFEGMADLAYSELGTNLV